MATATSPIMPGPAVFDGDAVPKETAALNASILARLAAAPDVWTFSIPEIRAARAAGKGSFPLSPPDDDAETMTIAGPHGPIDLRVMHPKSSMPRGTYLHIHGGGWIMGTPRENDALLRRHAEATGLSTVSVDYRLAPEHAYPHGPDDCESAALWLINEGGSDFSRDVLAIGGESAGAHLAVVTLLRLRDRYGLTPFAAANLNAGCYDLAMTPSVRNWKSGKLILQTRDIEKFIRHFLADEDDRRSPDISPLFANLAGLPPALFSCGTQDLLLDDTLFMAARWLAAGRLAETAIYPGGCHVFQLFQTRQAEESLLRIEAFLNTMIDAATVSPA